MEVIELSGARSELVVVVLPGRRQKSVVRGRGGEGGGEGEEDKLLVVNLLVVNFLVIDPEEQKEEVNVSNLNEYKVKGRTHFLSSLSSNLLSEKQRNVSKETQGVESKGTHFLSS
jgi:hypothetical protein